MATVPTVYFIDDSATMREVIKIAFRRENINVLTSHDAVQGLEEIEKNHPDIVITDVIMPVKDGYEVCQFIKTHPELSNIPVILMSGVVNRAVAERAFAVKADELLRKPFQPQDLISRVRNLLAARGMAKASPAAAANANAVLSNIFSSPVPLPSRSNGVPVFDQAIAMNTSAAASSSVAMLERPVPASSPVQPAMSMSPAFSVVVPDVDPLLEVANVSPRTPSVSAAPVVSPAMAAFSVANFTVPVPTNKPMEQTAIVGSTLRQSSANNGSANAPAKPANADLNMPRLEILRLEGLVKKLQAELHAEREYSKALEAHIKTLQESER
jgi:twitching motility two-component system response regulator PilH